MPVADQFDVTLLDGALLAEVELLTRVMIAASHADSPLSEAQIDAVIGVDQELFVDG